MINITQLADEIARIFADYGAEVVQAVNGAAEEVAKACAEDLKQTSPKRSGGYRRSWKYKRMSGSGKRPQVWVVYNDKHARLTHLLEKGHATKGGGRARAIPHIAPAEERAAELFEDKALEAIGRVTG